MQFKNEIGILYDAIFFGYAYFNDGDQTGGISADAYREVLAAVEELPGWMRPFFTNDVENMTVLPPEVAYGADSSINGLLDFLSDETDVLSCLSKHYFQGEKLSAVAPGRLYRLCEEAEISDNTKMALPYLFADYSSLHFEVRKEFYRLYSAMKSFHDKQEGKVRNVVDKLLEHGAAGILMDEQTKAVFGVSLMRPDVLALSRNEGAPVIVCGPKANVAAHAPTLETTPLVDFTVACGSEAKMKILDLFAEHGNLTAAQLARLMDISAPMAWRYTEMLRNANVILEDRGEGRKEIYYRLNLDYFRGVRRSLDELISRLEAK